MEASFTKILEGYQVFRKRYALNDQSVMQCLSRYGQQPKIMVVGCCDARVDPALLLQCDPGDLFVIRNVANIVPPYQKDTAYHGTSAALEFGIRFLHIKQLILLGHSQCGGIEALLSSEMSYHSDFISSWVAIVKAAYTTIRDVDTYAKVALKKSYQHCMTFPWINEKVRQKNLTIHLWFFDIEAGKIHTYSDKYDKYSPI